MIIQGIDANSVSHPLLLAADGSVILRATDLTTTGGKIKVDASGRVVINADNPSYLQPTGIAQTDSNLNLAAGVNVLNGYTVPASQRVQLDGVTVIYVGTVATVALYPFIYDGVNEFYLPSVETVVSLKRNFTAVSIIMEAGWQVRARVINATLNDDLYLTAFVRRIL